MANYQYSDETLFYFQAFSAIIVFLFLCYMWAIGFPIVEESNITIINGITTSTSLMIASSGVLLNYSYNNKIMNLGSSKKTTQVMVATMVFSGIFLFASYLKVVNGDTATALKTAMTALSISLLGLLSFAILFYGKLYNKK